MVMKRSLESDDGVSDDAMNNHTTYSDTPLPNGWKKVLHRSGLVCFYHEETGVVSWSKPYALAKDESEDHVQNHVPPLEIFAEGSGMRNPDRNRPVKMIQAKAIIRRLNKFVPSLDAPVEQSQDSRKKAKATPVDTIEQSILSSPQTNIATPPRVSGTKSTVGRPKVVLNGVTVEEPTGKTAMTFLMDYTKNWVNAIPEYIQTNSDDIENPFTSTVNIGNKVYGTGHGSSKQLARQEAAEMALEALIPGYWQKMKHSGAVRDIDTTASESSKAGTMTMELFRTLSIDDPQVLQGCMDLNVKTPAQLLSEYQTRNKGVAVNYTTISLPNPTDRNKFQVIASNGQKTAEAIAPNKKLAKQYAAQALLRVLHPTIATYLDMVTYHETSATKGGGNSKSKASQQPVSSQTIFVPAPSSAIHGAPRPGVNPIYNNRNGNNNPYQRVTPRVEQMTRSHVGLHQPPRYGHRENAAANSPYATPGYNEPQPPPSVAGTYSMYYPDTSLTPAYYEESKNEQAYYADSNAEGYPRQTGTYNYAQWPPPPPSGQYPPQQRPNPYQTTQPPLLPPPQRQPRHQANFNQPNTLLFFMSYTFYSLVSAVKDKSAKAISTLSSDLKEFSSTVQGDVAEAAKQVKKKVEETIEANTAADNEDHEEEEQPRELQAKVTASIFAFGATLESVGTKILLSADEFLGGLTEDATPDSIDEPIDEATSARRFRLSALQNAVETYTEVPANTEAFQKWREAIADEEWLTLQSEVLIHYPAVQKKMQELVPDTVSEDNFWGYYMYKASKLAAQEQRSALLLEKVQGDEEEIGWDVDSPPNSPTAKKSPTDQSESPLETNTRSIPSHDSKTSVTSQQSDEWVDVEEKKTPDEVALVLGDNEVLDWGDDDEVPPVAKANSDDWGQWE
ncbi:hypothetical protein THRCLA_04969 [Thraustotheca clavata]|uniref:BSD domain-containing protein n=1 Tax=Thraustotheca clavata TaxID=74557 RepID=A0A1V9ZXC7_9STRA|nr:hypothetical protein THRCLA_04969 [Thraustotheca clavata]